MEILLEDPNYEVLDYEGLTEQYKESLAPILEKRKKLKIEIDELEEFILDKDKIHSELEKEEALIRQQHLKAEDKTYGEIQGDLEYAIYWMRNGHKPESRRGIERRSIYQNTKLMDHLLVQQYFRSNENNYFWDNEQKESSVTLSERINIDELLSCLTHTEREVYLMKKGHALSLKKIADERGVSKASISATIKRAEKKIAKRIQIMEEKEREQWNTFNQLEIQSN